MSTYTYVLLALLLYQAIAVYALYSGYGSIRVSNYSTSFDNATITPFTTDQCFNIPNTPNAVKVTCPTYEDAAHAALPVLKMYSYTFCSGIPTSITIASYTTVYSSLPDLASKTADQFYYSVLCAGNSSAAVPNQIPWQVLSYDRTCTQAVSVYNGPSQSCQLSPTTGGYLDVYCATDGTQQLTMYNAGQCNSSQLISVYETANSWNAARAVIYSLGGGNTETCFSVVCGTLPYSSSSAMIEPPVVVPNFAAYPMLLDWGAIRYGLNATSFTINNSQIASTRSGSSLNIPIPWTSYDSTAIQFFCLPGPPIASQLVAYAAQTSSAISSTTNTTVTTTTDYNIVYNWTNVPPPSVPFYFSLICATNEAQPISVPWVVRSYAAGCQTELAVYTNQSDSCLRLAFDTSQYFRVVCLADGTQQMQVFSNSACSVGVPPPQVYTTANAWTGARSEFRSFGSERCFSLLCGRLSYSSSIVASSSYLIASSSVVASSSYPIASSSIIASSSYPIASSSVVASSSAPIASSSISASSSYPIASSSNPIASSSAPIASSSIVGSSSYPIASSSAPIASSSVLASSSAVVGSSSQPIGSSSAPVASSSVPTGSSSMPVASSSVLASSSATQFSSSNVASSSNPIASSSLVPFASSSGLTAASSSTRYQFSSSSVTQETPDSSSTLMTDSSSTRMVIGSSSSPSSSSLFIAHSSSSSSSVASVNASTVVVENGATQGWKHFEAIVGQPAAVAIVVCGSALTLATVSFARVYWLRSLARTDVFRFSPVPADV
jgi:hypothetical protein